MNRTTKGLLIGGVILIAAGGGAWRLGLLEAVLTKAAAPTPGPAGKSPPPPLAVVVDTVSVIDAPVELTAVGLAEATQTVSVRPRIDGQIAEAPFEEGQEVKAGQLLFQLDPRAAEAALRQAEGAAARDRAQLANAKREAERQSGLIASDYVSRSRYDEVRAQAAALEGTVRASEANVEQLRVQLSYHRITAPIDGRVGRMKLSPGATVRAADATPLVVINRVKPIDIAFTAPQNQLGALRAAWTTGAAVAIARAPDGATSEGKLSFIDNAIDQTAGSVTVKAQFANADEKLWPGMFAPITLRLGTDRGVAAVPTPAVQIGQNGAYLYVLKDGAVQLRAVAVGRAFNGVTVVTNGVKAGETVVVDGQMRLTDGAKVVARGRDGKPIAAASPPPAAAQ